MFVKTKCLLVAAPANDSFREWGVGLLGILSITESLNHTTYVACEQTAQGETAWVTLYVSAWSAMRMCCH